MYNAQNNRRNYHQNVTKNEKSCDLFSAVRDSYFSTATTIQGLIEDARKKSKDGSDTSENMPCTGNAAARLTREFRLRIKPQ